MIPIHPNVVNIHLGVYVHVLYMYTCLCMHGYCGGLALETPAQALIHSALSGVGEKMRRTGARKLVGRDKDRVIVYQLLL